YFIQGDTVIGDYRCKKLYTENNDYIISDDSVAFVSGIFEEDNKVYTVGHNGSLNKLYDFSQEVGTQFSANGSKYEVDSIKKVNVDGQAFRLFYLKWLPSFDYWDETTIWIEGIGTTLEHLMKTAPMIPNYGWLVSVEVNGKTIFTREGLSNALTSIQVKTINEWMSYEHDVYDLQGRRVLTPQRGGLYIQGGKKLIYK
ncbi:MAG: hypothetical protein II107_00685, partial [Prevotella sp.]|nr:hypothetical protein [Prevotella sp.]